MVVRVNFGDSKTANEVGLVNLSANKNYSLPLLKEAIRAPRL